MNAYVEIIGSNPTGMTVPLYESDLRSIGDFTRENIWSWLRSDHCFDFTFYGTDFHAVCGDIDIPWSTEESKLAWEKSQVYWGQVSERARAYWEKVSGRQS